MMRERETLRQRRQERESEWSGAVALLVAIVGAGLLVYALGMLR